MALHTLRVYFFGLICHVSEEESNAIKDYAYLVKADDHKPIVGYGAATGTNHSFVRIDPDATSIRLDLGDDEALTDLLFRTYVPSLRNLLGSDLASNAANFAIRFLYPRSSLPGAAGRGNLSVASLYPLKGRYRRSGAGSNTRHDGPVARLTELTIKTEQDTFDVIVSKGNTHTTIYDNVSTDGCLLIANMETAAIEIIENQDAPAVNVDLGDPHTNKYGVILKDPKPVAVSETDSNTDTVTPPACEWIDIVIKFLEEHQMRVSVSVECGNTDYP